MSSKGRSSSRKRARSKPKAADVRKFGTVYLKQAITIDGAVYLGLSGRVSVVKTLGLFRNKVESMLAVQIRGERERFTVQPEDQHAVRLHEPRKQPPREVYKVR